MELGLSLGDASKQNNKRAGFCMALGLQQNYDEEISQTALHLNLLPIRISSSHNGGSWENGSMYLRNVNQNVTSGKDVVEGENKDENGVNHRKKLRLSKHQSASLEQSFKQNNTLNPKEKVGLAKQLNLRARQVEVWFQNRRARTKLKQTEVECDYLKRCCETLTKENRRLHKELAELRALKTCWNNNNNNNNPFHQVATTLTMCPACERVATAAPPPPETTIRPTFVPFSKIEFH